MLTRSYTTLWLLYTHYWLVLDKYSSQLIEYQDNKQPRQISERKKIYTFTRMWEKWGLSHTNQEKNWSVIYFLLKKKGANHISGSAEKKGAIRHAHPYYVIYRKLPPPPSQPHPPPPPRLHFPHEHPRHTCPKTFFQINLSGIPSECQTVWTQIRPDVLSGLI